MTEWIIPVAVAVLSSNVLAVLLTLALNRKKTEAETERTRAEVDDIRIGTTLKVVDELQESLTDMRARFRDYRQDTDETIADLMNQLKIQEAELRVQEKAIDNLTAKTLKYSMILSILTMQLRQSGLEPLIDPEEIDTIKIDNLRNIFQGIHNAEARRQKRLQERDNEA